MPRYPITDQKLFAPLPTPDDMKAWDDAAITQFHIPEFTLMENASREAFHVVQQLCSAGSRIVMYMGGGNNGGDGAALARHLHDAGHQVLVYHTRPLELLHGAAKEHTALARKVGVAFTPVDAAQGAMITPEYTGGYIASPDLVIDALLGTGFQGPLRELELTLIRHINTLRGHTRIIALDIPSGLDGMTGKAQPDAVRAHHTITFEAAKIGLYIPEARPFVGELHERKIGIPASIRQQYPAQFRRIAPCKGILQHISPEMHKGSAGHVLVVGGSEHYTGAPLLAAIGALRAGAGLVSIACPGGLSGRITSGWPELIQLPLGTSTEWSEEQLPMLLSAINTQSYSAIVLGPGMGRAQGTTAVITALLSMAQRPPIILDADGLFPLAAQGITPSPLLSLLRQNDCITPHPGEAARILGMDVPVMQQDRPAALKKLTSWCSASVILKGAGTLVGQHDAPITLATFQEPALAVGGSGDVLSGVCAALVAAGYDTLPAASLGVYLHGRAGELLSIKYPARGNLAREIADMVSTALAELV